MSARSLALSNDHHLVRHRYLRMPSPSEFPAWIGSIPSYSSPQGLKLCAISGNQFDTAEFVKTVTDAHDITEAEVIESLWVLEAERYIEIHRTMAPGLMGMRVFTITTYGLEIYLRACEADYARFEQIVLARIAEQPGGQGTERDLASSVDVPPMVVRHLLDMLASSGDLRLSKPPGGPQSWHFYNVSPRLRRRSHH